MLDEERRQVRSAVTTGLLVINRRWSV